MWIAILLGIEGCPPELTSPDSGQATWEAPENTWPVADPPDDLEADGFGEGQVVPDFLLQDQHGDMVSLWQFHGMVIALDVSTMWCAPCQELAGEVQATWEDYEDEGFIYLTVLPEDLAGEVPDVEDLNSWADNFGIEAPVLADGSGFGYELVGSDAYPAIMIVSRDLTVAVERVTPAEDATIRAAIEDEL